MASSIFDNIYKEDLLGWRTENGLNYQKIVDFLDLNKNEISKLTGVSKRSIRFDHKMPKEVSEKLNEIADICLLVADFFYGDLGKTSLWFRAANPILGDISPRDMIRFGKDKKLMQFVIAAQQDGKRVAK